LTSKKTNSHSSTENVSRSSKSSTLSPSKFTSLIPKRVPQNPTHPRTKESERTVNHTHPPKKRPRRRPPPPRTTTPSPLSARTPSTRGPSSQTSTPCATSAARSLTTTQTSAASSSSTSAAGAPKTPASSSTTCPAMEAPTTPCLIHELIIYNSVHSCYMSAKDASSARILRSFIGHFWLPMSFCTINNVVLNCATWCFLVVAVLTCCLPSMYACL